MRSHRKQRRIFVTHKGVANHGVSDHGQTDYATGHKSDPERNQDNSRYEVDYVHCGIYI